MKNIHDLKKQCDTRIADIEKTVRAIGFQKPVHDLLVSIIGVLRSHVEANYESEKAAASSPSSSPSTPEANKGDASSAATPSA